ncbi:hypothetical protein ACFYV7_06215 [Nocardia suismassiliense]|uniref:Uncharacterized protein n=1 Tax=Nocardia suismassiliense TaxID=2077092 RepID=A0ABW6QMD8_9NOCA
MSAYLEFGETATRVTAAGRSPRETTDGEWGSGRAISAVARGPHAGAPSGGRT